MTDLEKLQERVGNGIRWLDEHDPKGIFHLWFTAGIPASGPFPAHKEDDAPARYAEYVAARKTFERLDKELAIIEKRAGYKLGKAEWTGATR